MDVSTEPSTPMRSVALAAVTAQYSAPVGARLPKTDMSAVIGRRPRRPRSRESERLGVRWPPRSPRPLEASPRRRKRRRSSLLGAPGGFDAHYSGPITIDYLRYFCQKSVEEAASRADAAGAAAAVGEGLADAGVGTASPAKTEFDLSLPLPHSPQSPARSDPFVEEPQGRPLSYLERILASQAKRHVGGVRPGAGAGAGARGAGGAAPVALGARSPKTPANAAGFVIEDTSRMFRPAGEVADTGDLGREEPMVLSEPVSEVVLDSPLAQEAEPADFDAESPRNPRSEDPSEGLGEGFPSEGPGEGVSFQSPPSEGESLRSPGEPGSSGSPGSPSIIHDEYTMADAPAHPLAVTPAAAPTATLGRARGGLALSTIRTLMRTVLRSSAAQSHLPVRPVAAETYSLLQDATDAFMTGVAGDLEAYAQHRSRGSSRQINVRDALLYLKRTNFVARAAAARGSEVDAVSRMASEYLPLETLVALEQSMEAVKR
ncbi:CENP-T/Histone H4 histone fold domain-containing protein [[Candida] zeylanoides]